MNQTSVLSDKTKEVGGLLRDLRNAAGLSLSQAEEKFGLSAAVIGSYERGDRQPSIYKINELLGRYGYEVLVGPIGSVIVPPAGADARPRVWTPPMLATALRSISAHMDAVLARHNMHTGER